MTPRVHRIAHTDLVAAKWLMSAGASMTEAAVRVGVLAAELDKALWDTIGVPPEELTPTRRAWVGDF